MPGRRTRRPGTGQMDLGDATPQPVQAPSAATNAGLQRLRSSWISVPGRVRSRSACGLVMKGNTPVYRITQRDIRAASTAATIARNPLREKS